MPRPHSLCIPSTLPPRPSLSLHLPPLNTKHTDRRNRLSTCTFSARIFMLKVRCVVPWFCIAHASKPASPRHARRSSILTRTPFRSFRLGWASIYDRGRAAGVKGRVYVYVRSWGLAQHSLLSFADRMNTRDLLRLKSQHRNTYTQTYTSRRTNNYYQAAAEFPVSFDVLAF